MKTFCPERVTQPHMFLSVSCGRPVKWLVRKADDTEVRVCGIHVRRYRRWDLTRVAIEPLP